MTDLKDFGWGEDFQKKWNDFQDSESRPARVIADFGTSLRIAMPELYVAELSGKLAHYSQRENIPKVGDWVSVLLSENGHAVIQAVLPRRSEIARKVAGNRTLKQTIAANVDTAFVLLALDDDFSVERLKRFLYQLSINNIRPVIVLNKADKTDDVGSYTKQLSMFNVPIIISTAITGTGVNEILDLITPGSTAILLGSSGVGKSTLTNQLLGREAQKTEAVRASDSTGKHTTVHRELFVLPGGGLLIDTPGIREIQLWGTEDELEDNFDDVADLAGRCKFTNCLHANEPGCAVRDALQNGTLGRSHYASYAKMKTELASLKQKNAVKTQLKNKRTQKSKVKRTRDDLNDMREQLS